MNRLAELLEAKARLEKQIEKLRKDERAKAITEIKELLDRFNIKVEDLVPKTVVGSKKAVAAKYRDPETGATWSGRGLHPSWLGNAIRGGRTIEDFIIR